MDCSSSTRLPLALGACLHTASSSPPVFADDTGHATPPYLAASTGGGGCFSPRTITPPTSAVYFTEDEIARLRALLLAFDSPLSGVSTLTSSVAPLTEQEIGRFQCLLAPSVASSSTGSVGSATDPSGIVRPPSTHAGSVGSATDSSGIVRPPSTQVGTSPWVLDTGASFHMTPDSSTLSSTRPLDSPVHVLTAAGTSLPVTGRGTLSTSSFHVPDVAHVPRLTM
ncbi:uncharacterized protein LOC123443694 [Hordeum vulgare subsp. vulgare]|uniref:uncharacterized protein LOC123443694 n=1 Tax=Hordeum vulgare subsp. vulgare TaxID=112509 RepID=UPI001D1A4C96|nr:uncharacterized protein LOC123443694 [Hordeum vulgare subsp. vulgare]